LPQPLANQLQPAQDKGAHQDLTQLRVLRNQRPQLLAAQFEKFAVLRYAPDHQALPSGNHGHLAGELARLVAGNHPFALERWLDDFHAPREQHEKRDRHVARSEQDISHPRLPNVPQRADAVDLFPG
jgi:hypothetical protein